MDRTLRLKVIDACGMTCTFCHNEGTPVVVDNLGRAPGEMTAAGRSGRVSLYLGTNGAKFLPATVEPTEGLASTLDILRDALHVDELHLTGGEPTLHPRLPGLVAVGVRAGFKVCATSNGENGARVLPACGKAGLERVNFSIFGTTAAELAQVQHGKYANISRAERKIGALQDAIRVAIAHGIGASANIVVPDDTHIPRVHRLLTEYVPGISVRLLNSLDDGERSIEAIHHLLVELKARAVGTNVTAGASGWRTAYRLPWGGSCSSSRSDRSAYLGHAMAADSTTEPTAKRATTACGSIAIGTGRSRSRSASSEWTSVFLWTSSFVATFGRRFSRCERLSFGSWRRSTALREGEMPLEFEA
jgi:cyclic pyranopterin phosphate synthase